MRLRRLFAIALLIISFAMAGYAQADTIRPLKIAVFAPVYLDSAFTGSEYRIASNSLPRYIVPGLDFYNGVMMAIDSLNEDHPAIEVRVYDSKSREASPAALQTDSFLPNASLIIASFNTRTEVKPLADFALAHKIPLLSATYPNDAGVKANPYFIMLNPRITTQIEAIHKYLQRQFPTDNIILFRKKGAMEDLILAILNEMNRKTAGTPVKFKTVLLSDTASAYQIGRHLDSSQQNIILCGTLNESFGMNLARGIADLNIPATIIGMPTWDGITGIGKGIDMIYSTPYNLTRTDQLSRHLDAKYRAKYALRPSDMFFKGYESMFRFTMLLLNHPGDLMDHLSDSEPKLFNAFDIQPAGPATAPDFMENRMIYFIRKIDNKLHSVD